jgi:mycothiol synthase
MSARLSTPPPPQKSPPRGASNAPQKRLHGEGNCVILSAMLKIEPVGRSDLHRALRLLSGGEGGGRLARLEAMLAGPGAQRCKLWWARTLRGPRAAAMSALNPGRCAMIFHSAPPRGRPGVRILSQLIGELTGAALADGAAFAQAMIPPGDARPAEAFEQAGYSHLAELIYMRRGMRRELPVADSILTWEAFSRGDEQRLEEIIADTYNGSQDCPGLLGLREMSDVLAAHKASGIFRPESWWIPTSGGEPVGCVLVNGAPGGGNACDLVYLGTRPKWRHKGFGRMMLRHALAHASAGGMKRMHLAVDSKNAVAVRLYRQEGFREQARQDVYIKPARGGA